MISDLSARVANAKPAVYWTDRPGAPESTPQLRVDTTADLCIVGAGFTGLWAALQAVEDNFKRSVVVIDAEHAGFGASTRNGGFCEASLTHGLENGLQHWPQDIEVLQKLGRDNLDHLLATLERHQIDAHVERTGQLQFATQPWQVDDLRASVELANQYGENHRFLDQAEAQAEVRSPTYLAGSFDPDGAAMVDPALLAWGLRQLCEEKGVRFYDQTRATHIEGTSSRIVVGTETGSVAASRVIVATNAWAEPIREMRRYVIPIYDHVLMTEPLTDEQMGDIGWKNRQGLADSGNQFHYYRLTKDNRILWGGYDANYYRGNGMGPEYEQRTESHELLASHFYETFPQLDALQFSHRWAGPIGTTSKFTAAFGTKCDDRVAWVAGYTGLGVGASRFGARVALSLISGMSTPATSLKMVLRKPMPFPPEPMRNAVIQFTRNEIRKTDANEGQPTAWLRLLDRFGVGFDS